MKKPIKIFLIIAVVLVVLLLVPVGIFLAIDLNDYKQSIAKAVNKATGRTLTLQGELSKSVFPWLGVNIGRVTFSNARGFQPAEFASADNIQIKVALLPLFKREIHVADVVLHGLVVNLAVNKEGVTNWADLTKTEQKPTTPTTSPAKPKNTPAATAPTAMLGALVIGGIDIQDAQLRWDDKKAGAMYQVDHLNLQSSEIRVGNPIHTQLSFNAHSNQIKAATQLSLTSDISLDPTSRRYQLANTQLTIKAQGDAIPGHQLESKISADLAADLKDETATIDKLKLETLGINISGKLNSKHLLSSPTLAGHLDIATFNPRELLKHLAITLPATSDPTVLNKASAAFDLQGDIDSINVDNLKLALDDTAISGKAGVNHFAQPSINYALSIDKINADRYLPPPSKKPTPPPASPGAAAATAAAQAPLPLDTLRQLDVSGTLDVGKLTADKLDLSELSTIFYAKGGQIRLHPLSAKLYDGSYDGDIKMDVRGDKPMFSVNEHIKGVKIGPILKAVADNDDLSGTATINAQLTSSGSELPAILQDLNGQANFHFNDGNIKNMDIKQIALSKLAQYQKKAPPAQSDKGKTYFAEMSGSVTVINGVAHNNDFLMNSHALQATGNGVADLPKQTINYHVQVKLLKSGLDDNSNQILAAIANEPIPLLITGPLTHPKFGLDSEAARNLLKASAKKSIKKKIEVKKQKKVDELRDKLKDKLKGLFGK